MIMAQNKETIALEVWANEKKKSSHQATTHAYVRIFVYSTTPICANEPQ